MTGGATEDVLLLWSQHRSGLMDDKLDLLHGTLDLMVLQTLAALGPQYGDGIARRIEQVSDAAIMLNQGTFSVTLARLQARRLIKADWGVSENNRRTRYYSLTPLGRLHLEERVANWQRIASVMERIFDQQ